MTTRFVFLGDYQTNVQLPDGSVLLVEPGEVVDLDFDEPGPLWAGSRTNVAKAAAAAADAAKAAADAAAVADTATPDPAPPAPPAV